MNYPSTVQSVVVDIWGQTPRQMVECSGAEGQGQGTGTCCTPGTTIPGLLQPWLNPPLLLYFWHNPTPSAATPAQPSLGCCNPSSTRPNMMPPYHNPSWSAATMPQPWLLYAWYNRPWSTATLHWLNPPWLLQLWLNPSG